MRRGTLAELERVGHGVGSAPTVTVVVPCYNYGRFLGQCVSSILEQPGVVVDVVIVDDASPDGSVDVARALAAADPRIRVIPNAVNQGHLRTYDIGLREATGTYVVLLSADDMLAPGSLARATTMLEAFPSLSFVYGFPEEFVDTPPAVDGSPAGWSTWTGTEWIARLCRRGSNLIASPEVVMRTSVLRAVGGFDRTLPHSADMYMWMEFAARGDVGRVNGPPQAFYRVHGDNMHLVVYSGLLTDIRERRRTFDRFFARYAGVAPGASHRVATRALGHEAVRLAHRCLENREPATARELADLATEWEPAVMRSWMGRSLRDRLRRPEERRSVHRAIAVRDDLANRVRWQLWRRYGAW